MLSRYGEVFSVNNSQTKAINTFYFRKAVGCVTLNS